MAAKKEKKKDSGKKSTSFIPADSEDTEKLDIQSPIHLPSAASILNQPSQSENFIKIEKELVDNHTVPDGHFHEAAAENYNVPGINAMAAINGFALNADIKTEPVDHLSNIVEMISQPAEIPLTSVSVAFEGPCFSHSTAIQKSALRTTECHSSQHDQNEYMESDLTIKQELLNDWNHSSSCIPSFGFSQGISTIKTTINCKVPKIEEAQVQDSAYVEELRTKFYRIQDFAAASDFSLADNYVSSSSRQTKGGDDYSKPDNSNSPQPLFSRSSVSSGTSVACAINSTCLELTNVLAEKESSHFTCVPKPTTMLSKDQPGGEIALVSGTSYAEYSNDNIDNSVNGKQPEICQDLNILHGKEMNDICNVAANLDSDSNMSICPVPSLLSNKSGNINSGFTRENGERNCREVDIGVNIPNLTSETPVPRNQICEIVESEEATDATASPHFEGFLPSWQLSEDQAGVHNEQFDQSLYTELAVYLRAENYKMKRGDNSYQFCERSMFGSVCVEELHQSDRTLWRKLYPSEVQVVEKKEMDTISLFNVSNNIIKTEPDGSIPSLEIRNDQPIKTRTDQIVGRRDDQTIKTETDQSTDVCFSQVIAKSISTETLHDIIKNIYSKSSEKSSVPYRNEETCSSADSCFVTNNFIRNELVSPLNAFKDRIGTNSVPNNSSKEIGIIIDDSVGNSRAYRSDDSSDGTARNSSMNGELSPRISLKENRNSKSRNQSPRFGERNNNRCQIVMGRKEQEKAWQIGNNRLREGKDAACSETLTSLTYSRSDSHEQSTFRPMLRNPIILQKRKLLLSGNDDNEKDISMHKETKRLAFEKRKDIELPPQQAENEISQVKKDERSNISDLVEIGIGNRFKNRNSSLFKDMVKGPQQPILYHKQGCQRVTALQAHPNQYSMEAVHSQIETNLISTPPAKKKLSYRDYQNRKATDPPPPSHPYKDLLNNFTRTLLPNIPQPSLGFPIPDPRLVNRNQAFNYYRNELPGYPLMNVPLPGYPLMNVPLPGYPLMNVPLPGYPLMNVPQPGVEVRSLQHAISNVEHPAWNSFLFYANSTSLATSQVLNQNFSRPYEPAAAYNPFLLPLTQAPLPDDMDLCTSSPESVIQNSSPLISVASSDRMQNPGCSFSFAPSSQPNGSIHSTFPKGRYGLSCSRNECIYESDALLTEILDSIDDNAISCNDALMIILAWTPTWLDEVDAQPRQPPPILGGRKKALKHVCFIYANMTEIFTTIFPLMMYDLFYRIRDAYKDLKGTNGYKYELDVTKISHISNMVELEAQMLLDKKYFCTNEGQLAIVSFILSNGKKREQFGYISEQKIYVDTPRNTLQREFLQLKIKTILDVYENAKISVFVFYPLWKTLNQIKALSAIDESPLRDIILTPSQSTCSKLIFKINEVTSGSSSTLNCAVQKIKADIALDNQDLPKVLVIDTEAGLDLIPTLVADIVNEKKLELATQKRRVLVCSRNSKRLEEIALRITSTASKESIFSCVETVILARAKSLSYPKLRKFTLEDKLHQRRILMKNISDAAETIPLELFSKELQVQKYVLGNCDVILSAILQLPDKIVDSMFGIGKDFQFSLCIIDESYTCPEPEVFLPLLYGMNKLILAGDPQMKPRHVADVCRQRNFYIPLPLRISKVLKM